jgi:hypothetical protein
VVTYLDIFMRELFLKIYPLFFVLFIIACQPTQNRAQTNKKMEPVSLVPFKKTYQVKLGQELAYQYTNHPSVGLNSDYSIGRTRLIELKEERKEYKNPEHANDSDGGDEATVYLSFKTLNKGATVIVVNEYYQGNLKEKYIFEIEIIE